MQIDINNNPLIFWGDCHGNYDAIYNFFRNKEYAKLENPQSNISFNFIQVGDFGIGLKSKEREKMDLTDLNQYLIEFTSHLYVIRGNHDDPNYFNGYYKNLLNLSNIHIISDYSVLSNDKHNILCVGGAISIDRMKRKKYNSELSMIGSDFLLWYKDEKFKLDLAKIENICQTYDKIDIVVTHSAPYLFPPTIKGTIVDTFAKNDTILIKELDEERHDINELFKNIISKEVEHWFYGHFHRSQHFELSSDNGQNINGHLLDIDEFYELV